MTVQIADQITLNYFARERVYFTEHRRVLIFFHYILSVPSRIGIQVYSELLQLLWLPHRCVLQLRGGGQRIRLLLEYCGLRTPSFLIIVITRNAQS